MCVCVSFGPASGAEPEISNPCSAEPALLSGMYIDSIVDEGVAPWTHSASDFSPCSVGEFISELIAGSFDTFAFPFTCNIPPKQVVYVRVLQNDVWYDVPFVISLQLLCFTECSEPETGANLGSCSSSDNGSTVASLFVGTGTASSYR